MNHTTSSQHTYSSSLWAYGLFTVIIGIFLLLYILGIFTSIFGLDTALLLTLIAGFPLLQDAISDLLAGRLSTYLIIAIAAGAALAIGEYFAAAEVMFIMLVGEGLERFTVERAHHAITGFFQDQTERQRLTLMLGKGTWRIIETERSRRSRPLIPYGEPIEK
jgi:cation transport ATPase